MNEDVLGLEKHQRGKIFTLSELDELVRTLSRADLFQGIYLEQIKGNQVMIRAQKVLKLRGIDISGNQSHTEEELLRVMRVKPGENLSEIKISQAIQNLKLFYKNTGFYKAQIQVSKEKSGNKLFIKINIDEGDICLVEKIQIHSSNEKLNVRIQKIIPNLLKKTYEKNTNKDIKKLIDQFLLENRFLIADVRHIDTQFNKDKDRVSLKFKINNPIEFQFVFNGNQFFSHIDLISQSKIGNQFLYASDPMSDIVDALTNLYQKTGFPNVKIRIRNSYASDAQKNVYVLDIDEGPRVRMGRIKVLGRISRNSSFYAQLFEDYLAETGSSIYYVRKKLEEAAEKVTIHLKRNGYFLAKILSISAETTRKNTALVSIQMDEGILTYIRQILFRGSKSFSNIELKEKIEIESNTSVNMKKIEDSFRKIEQFYKNKGFLDIKIKNPDASVIQYKKGQPYVDLVYEIDEGDQIVVGEIKVKGIKRTEKHVIIRELDFGVGDILNLYRVTNSVDRLERIGLFAKVNIRLLEKKSKTSKRTVLVEVEERKPGLFSAGAGIFNNRFFSGRSYVGGLYNNLWGKARGLSARLDVTYSLGIDYPENRMTFTYYEPYLTTNRVRGRVSLIREQRFNSFTRIGASGEENPIIQTSNEFRFSTEKEFSKHFRFTYNVFGFTNQEYFGVKNDLDPLALGRFPVQNIGTTGPILELDYRNDPFIPTDGSYTRLEVEYSNPILGSSQDDPNLSGISPSGRHNDPTNEINYIRTSFLTNHFTPLSRSKRWVWANSLQGGYLRNLSQKQDSGVPQVRAFFLGGSAAIRGFAVGEFVPGQRELCINQGFFTIDAPTECNLPDVVIRKNSSFLLFKSELRFPLSGNWGGLLFYDGGAVFLGDFRLQDPYRDSVGAGMSYKTPVGSFVMAVGWKLDPKQGGVGTYYDREAPLAIHLAIGTF